ncbi:hypothetical protein BC831DRAFT_463107 [Entophlyctis helioformis]|nr:hypothetical protein BC831DRAFT_463107 [Entophlyctis helioformis]
MSPRFNSGLAHTFCLFGTARHFLCCSSGHVTHTLAASLPSQTSWLPSVHSPSTLQWRLSDESDSKGMGNIASGLSVESVSVKHGSGDPHAATLLFLRHLEPASVVLRTSDHGVCLMSSESVFSVASDAGVLSQDSPPHGFAAGDGAESKMVPLRLLAEVPGLRLAVSTLLSSMAVCHPSASAGHRHHHHHAHHHHAHLYVHHPRPPVHVCFEMPDTPAEPVVFSIRADADTAGAVSRLFLRHRVCGGHGADTVVAVKPVLVEPNLFQWAWTRMPADEHGQGSIWREELAFGFMEGGSFVPLKAVTFAVATKAALSAVQTDDPGSMLRAVAASLTAMSPSSASSSLPSPTRHGEDSSATTSTNTTSPDRASGHPESSSSHHSPLDRSATSIATAASSSGSAKMLRRAFSGSRANHGSATAQSSSRPVSLIGGGSSNASGQPLAQPISLAALSTTASPTPSTGVAEFEDGPLFRATVASYESKTANLKHSLKRTIKAAQTYMESTDVSMAHHKAFVETLASLPNLQPSTLKYIETTNAVIHRLTDMTHNQFNALLIEPLRGLYDREVKLADQRKRDFDHEANEYYVMESKYLAMRADEGAKKKMVLADGKFQSKRRSFELRCFDYFHRLAEMHGPRMEMELSFVFTNYAEKQTNFYSAVSARLTERRSELEDIVAQLSLMTKSIHLHSKEVAEKRKMIEAKWGGGAGAGAGGHGGHLSVFASQDYLGSVDHLAEAGSATTGSTPMLANIGPVDAGFGSLAASISGALALSTLGISTWSLGNASSSATGAGSATTATATTPGTSTPTTFASLGRNETSAGSPTKPPGDAKFRGIRDLNTQNDPDAALLGRRREGFLFVAFSNITGGAALSVAGGTGNVGWRKSWCVVARGHLEGASASQHCCMDSVVSLPSLTRAMHTEHSNWRKLGDHTNVTSVNLRCCTVREARNVDRRFCFEVVSAQGGRRIYQATDEDDLKAWITVVQNAIEAMLNGMQSGHDLTDGGSLVRAGTPETAGDRNSITGSPDQGGGSILAMLWAADPGNKVCADCGTKSPDWISINLGCLVCKECSGMHRGLGTHITKIRSATLDTVSWTPETLGILQALGNTASNAVWERRGPKTKPRPTDRTDVKMAFVKDKVIMSAYLGRFVLPC